MVSFLYHFAWTLVFIVSIPLILFTRDRRLPERLGLRLHGIPTKRKRIWLHALSVGEVISALPIIKAINRKYPSKPIALTVKTSQGMEVARNELGDEIDLLLPMPLDFWWSIRRVVHFIRPYVLIYVETDVWPGLISYLEKRDIKIILINGRISPRTFSSYRRYGFFVRRKMDSLDLFLMQSDLDKRRLLEIGLSAEKIEAVGNIKFDRTWRPMDKNERDQWLDLLHLRHEHRLWVAGSTHEGEDEIVLETFKRLIGYFPELRLIIAPRKPERADDIHRMSVSKGLKTQRRSHSKEDKDQLQVVILDTIGELERIYGLADVSFIGGSMVPIGGHNLLEPASFGCPVLFGVHTHNFVQMAQLLIETGGGKRVKDEEDLFSTIKGLLSDPERLERMALRAKEFVKMNSGALERVMEYLDGYIESE